MRLKSVYISEYKNLKEFTLGFDGENFLDIFIGKNGTGKSNLFEALTEIFRHIFESQKSGSDFKFPYKIIYEIEGEEVSIEWKEGKFTINGQSRKTIGSTKLPDNVLIYYSGHNQSVAHIISDYERSFRGNLKDAQFQESRRFIGVGSDYKSLLLSTLLFQPDTCRAKNFVMQKLNISSVKEEAFLVITKPYFWKSSPIDVLDTEQQFWRVKGIARDFLDKVITCIKGDFSYPSLYTPDNETYTIPINIELWKSRAGDLTISDLFRQLDNLKTLDMLQDIALPVVLGNGITATTDYFSDGQFQSVYIYTLMEIFKDKNCITLLDEPDSFLHPEWQFDFLKQVFEITESAAAKNHILMSSHSASTITTAQEKQINLFEFDGENLSVSKRNKSEIIKSLSAGLITFSESEARLNIQHVLKNTKKPILFTEGITDEIILEVAWEKLYAGNDRPFEIQNAFSCSFMRALMKDPNLYQNYVGRQFFALFDFDSAFDEWNSFDGDLVSNDPMKGLIKKRRSDEGYVMLLPVPVNEVIKKQVINPSTGQNYGGRSLLTIELLFYGLEQTITYFQEDESRPDRFIKFQGDKVNFAKSVLPRLGTQDFEPLKPIFDFILGRINPP